MKLYLLHSKWVADDDSSDYNDLVIKTHTNKKRAQKHKKECEAKYTGGNSGGRTTFYIEEVEE
jgi:hypothetical protein